MDTVIPYAMVSRGHSNGSKKDQSFCFSTTHPRLDQAFLLAFWASICLETEVRPSTNTTLIIDIMLYKPQSSLRLLRELNQCVGLSMVLNPLFTG